MTDKNELASDIPPPPERPSDEECCNNGCEELCVFEIYKIQKANYEAKWGDKSDKLKSND